MTVRAFKIKWQEDLGPMWMNVDNLAQCLTTKTYTGEGLVEKIEDVTDQLETLTHLAGTLKEMCEMTLRARDLDLIHKDLPLVVSAIETKEALGMLFPKMFEEDDDA